MPYKILYFLLINFFLFGKTSHNASVPDNFHTIFLKGYKHNVKKNKSFTLKAISNKAHQEFYWSVENESIAKVTQKGKVTALNEGVTLIIAESKRDGEKGIFLLVVKDKKKRKKRKQYANRGILLFPKDIDSLDWVKLAHNVGINTIGIHPGGGHLKGIIANFNQWTKTKKFKKFILDCKKYNIEVEYEIHAVKELLPRKLFFHDPSMFPSRKGKRMQKNNLCVHSYEALKHLATSVVEFSKVARPTTSRYYFWIDDAQPMCRCFACKNYNDAEQALIMELYLQKELQKYDPDATIAHLAFATTLTPPKKILPNNKVFLEFADITRKYDKMAKYSKNSRFLIENLKVFPAKTTQILEYWVDASLWYRAGKKPVPWKEKVSKVIKQDIRYFRNLGIKHFTSFGNRLDANYRKLYGFKLVEEYGQILQSLND